MICGFRAEAFGRRAPPLLIVMVRRMRSYIGTSGYSYPKWKGRFYPAKCPQHEMLRYYAERYSTVEINSTFFSFPNETTIASWINDTPDSFRFALKAHRAITHLRRLKDVEDATARLLHTASMLNGRLGSLLFQFPPNFKKDVPRLEAFLDLLDGKVPSAFEFRHDSWSDDDVFACLRARSCAVCLADTDEAPIGELVSTTDWGYVRLRRADYTDEELAEWAKRLRFQNWREMYVFFMHEDTGTGPRFAARLRDLLNA
jgi:uncharacterized protein YecE (DUF72 family)